MISTERRDGVAFVRMDDGKANAIQERFLSDIDAAFDAAAGDAIVLTGARKIFSAGLDLPALVDLSQAEMTALMEHFHETMRRIFLWPAPVVAAVNGHAIAGGCVLAMQADRRVMADGDGKIGINEVQIYLPLPVVVVETFRAQLSPASLAAAAQEGRLFSPAEARELGVVDAVVQPDGLETRAVETARRLAAVGRPAFAGVKALLRRPAAEALERTRAEDARAWIDAWRSDATRNRIREIVARLKSR